MAARLRPKPTHRRHSKPSMSCSAAGPTCRVARRYGTNDYTNRTWSTPRVSSTRIEGQLCCTQGRHRGQPLGAISNCDSGDLRRILRPTLPPRFTRPCNCHRNSVPYRLTPVSTIDRMKKTIVRQCSGPAGISAERTSRAGHRSFLRGLWRGIRASIEGAS